MKISLKKLLTLAALFSSAAAFAQSAKPSWYSDDVTVKEQTIQRKNTESVYVEYTDTSYDACAFCKYGDPILSLEQARDEAEKAATEKLTNYLTEKNLTEALSKTPKMVSWKYDDNKATAGAYVMVEVKTSKEKVKAILAKDARETDISKISFRLPHILSYKDENLTMVDNINPASQENLQAHKVRLTTENRQLIKDAESYYYPDGTLVNDVILKSGSSALSFGLRNVVKGRMTLIIMRVDCINENEYTLSYGSNEYKAKISKDDKNRWRNICFEIPEDTIKEYSPEFTLSTSGGNTDMASVYIYQKL